MNLTLDDKTDMTALANRIQGLNAYGQYFNEIKTQASRYLGALGAGRSTDTSA